jgi:hypothetical protein
MELIIWLENGLTTPFGDAELNLPQSCAKEVMP